jgi:hypothetical protein
MKSLLLSCALVLLAGTVAAQTRPSPTPTPNVPNIKEVDNLEVPSGAVIQLRLGAYDLDALKRCKLEIGAHRANFTVLEGSKADEPRVAAVVPDMQGAREGGGPALIVFFNEQGHGGEEIRNFRVIPSSADGFKVTIVSVTQQPNLPYFDVRFQDEIPTGQWGHVNISIDDRPAERIVRILPKVFSFEMPKNLPYAFRHDLVVEVGGVRSDVHRLNTALVSANDPTTTATPIQVSAPQDSQSSLGSPIVLRAPGWYPYLTDLGSSAKLVKQDWTPRRSFLLTLRCIQYARPQQIKLSPAIHLSLQ